MSYWRIPEVQMDNTLGQDEIFEFDFTSYLDGSNIASIERVNVPSGLTNYSETFDTKKVYLGLRSTSSIVTDTEFLVSVKIASNDSPARKPTRTIKVIVQPM